MCFCVIYVFAHLFACVCMYVYVCACVMPQSRGEVAKHKDEQKVTIKVNKCPVASKSKFIRLVSLIRQEPPAVWKLI